MLKRKKGLTMMELLGSIVIIGIISAIALPNIWTFINKSDLAAKEIEETKMTEVVEKYYETRGSIPTVEHGLIGTQSFKENCLIDIHTSNYTTSSKNLCKLDTQQLKKEKILKAEVNSEDVYFVFFNGKQMKISYDIPKEFIEVSAKAFEQVNGQYPLKNGSSDEINVKALSLPKNPVFTYIRMENGTVERLVKD